MKEFGEMSIKFCQNAITEENGGKKLGFYGYVPNKTKKCQCFQIVWKQSNNENIRTKIMSKTEHLPTIHKFKRKIYQNVWKCLSNFA